MAVVNYAFISPTGSSFGRAIEARRRVERAKLLIQDESLSIAQIGFATGFAHHGHLSRHMRKILGVTPAVARRDLVRPRTVEQAANV